MNTIRTVVAGYQFHVDESRWERVDQQIRAIRAARESLRAHHDRTMADPVNARIAVAWEAARIMNLTREQMAALRRSVLRLAGRKR